LTAEWLAYYLGAGHKYRGQRSHQMKFSTFTAVAGWLTCFIALNIIVKNLSVSTADQSLFQQLLSIAKSPILYVAGVLYVTCALLYFLALGRLPLSTAGPMFMVLGVASTALIGFFVFGETVSTMKLAGLAFCLFGIGMLFLSKA
jgi:multidrug transporter EmrE-like cation transporter